MKLKTTFIFNSTPGLALLLSLLPLAVASPAFAQAQTGPTITLPPDEPQPAIKRPPLLQLPRESQIEVPLEQTTPGPSTAIGGYGELTFNAPSNAPNVIDLRRLVVYIGHNFTDRLRFYGELEMEHAVTSATDKGEFEVEQAFLDGLAWKPLNFRVVRFLFVVVAHRRHRIFGRRHFARRRSRHFKFPVRRRHRAHHGLPILQSQM